LGSPDAGAGVGKHVLFAVSKSDLLRLDEVARFTGAARTPEDGAKLLALTNRVWRTNTTASRFVSDTMVAAWLDNKVLHRDIPELFSEPDQYRLLAWYCCARPLDSGCQMSSEPVDPILERMARESVAESPSPRLPYTALMMSLYHFRPDVRDAVVLRGAERPTLLGWYYAHGVRELAIIHHVGADEWAALNEAGDDGLSLLCRFALEWLPHPQFDLTAREDRARAWAWFTQAASREEPFASLVREPAEGGSDAPPDESDGDDAAGSPYAVAWRSAEYFDRRGGGGRLLYSGEWFPVEEEFSWSRVPWASLMFRLAGPPEDTVNIGVLFQTTEDIALVPDRELTIYVNGTALWIGVVRSAAGRELIIRAPRQILRAGSVNLLQFHVPEPFVPADVSASADSRRLGVPLRRLWVSQPGGRRPEPVERAQKPRLSRVAAEPLPENERLLVLRGDLRSHTGYAKEARALAKLVPAPFRTIGVDIHPDPADNKAEAGFPIVAEAEALTQVVEHPRRAVVLHATSPDEFALWPNARNVGWPSWETDAVPYLRQWPLRIRLMDAIWAKTGFMADFVRGAGYRGPVHSVPWPHEFTAIREPSADGGGDVVARYFDALADLRHPHRPRFLSELRSDARVLFLAVQSMAPRKGLPLLLSEWRAHVEDAGAGDILVLRLAFRHMMGLAAEWEETFLDALGNAGFGRGARVRIAVIPQALPEAELAGVYRIADALLSMSYGEGFGGPIVEALQHECPVIAPRHTGLRDLLPEDYPLAIASTRMAVALRGNLPNYPHSATWHIPQPGELCRKLGEFAAMSGPARRALMQDCRKHAMGFCWTPVVRQLLAAALDDLDLDAAVRRVNPTSPVRHAAD
jgi:hypothetical protein